MLCFGGIPRWAYDEDVGMAVREVWLLLGVYVIWVSERLDGLFVIQLV